MVHFRLLQLHFAQWRELIISIANGHYRFILSVMTVCFINIFALLENMGALFVELCRNLSLLILY